MNVRCSSCATIYRIDPSKVTEAGARARCTVCSNVISIARDEGVVAPAPVPASGSALGDTAPMPAVRLSQEDIAAAVLGDAFIAPSKQEAPPVPSPVAAPAPAAPSPPPPSPVVPTPEPATAASDAAPSQRVEPEEPPASPLAPPPLAAPVAAAPVNRPPVEKGGLRVARPFAPPRSGQRPTKAPQEPQRPTAPVFRPTPGMPLKPASPPPAKPEMPAAPPVAAAPPAPAASPESPPTLAPPGPPEPPAAPAAAAAPPTPAPAARKPVINPFMSKDPKQKARRLARALISDMIVYQPEKRQKAVDDGSLKEAFDEEIKKSWQEYVQQVGEEIANSTPFFTEALNEILAGGQPVF